MNEPVKFEDLTKEQQDAIRKAGKKYIIKGILTGMNYGGLICMSNLVLILANGAFFHSSFLLFAACVAVDIKLLLMMEASNQENTNTFRESLEQVLKK